MKQEIEKLLLAKGFVQDEDQYKKQTKQVARTVIVNGEQHQEYQELTIAFKYIGEGWEGTDEQHANPLTQWALYVNGECVTEVLVHDVNEFATSFKF